MWRPVPPLSLVSPVFMHTVGREQQEMLVMSGRLYIRRKTLRRRNRRVGAKCKLRRSGKAAGDVRQGTCSRPRERTAGDAENAGL